MRYHARTSRFLGFWLPFFLLFSLSTVPVWGTSKPAETPAPAATKNGLEGPLAFAVTEIIPHSERALTRLHQTRARLDADTAVEVVESELPAFARQLTDWWKAEGQSLNQSRSLQRVSDLSWELGLRENQINAWKLLLSDRSKAWVAEEQALDRLMVDWKATSSALSKQAPPAVQDRTADVLREGEATQGLLRQKTARLIAVQSQLNALQEDLNEVRGQLDELRARSKRDLLSLDSPPLWTALSGEQAAGSINAQTSAGSQEIYTQADAFLQLIRTRMVLHLLVFAALVALFHYLRRSSRRDGNVRPTAAEQFIIDRSFASALLLAICWVPLIYADASPRLMRLTVLPGMIPVLMLSPAIIGPRLRVGFFAFTVIYLIDYVRVYLPPDWLLARLLLLCMAVFGAAGILLLLRAHRREPLAAKVGSGATRLVLLIGLLLFVGSLLANVAGNVSTAEFLVSPLMRVLFLGAAIRLGVVVSTTFMVMALRTPLARRSRLVRERSEAVALQLRRLFGMAGAGLWIFLALFSLGLLEDFSAALHASMAQEWQLGAAVISVRDFVSFFVVVATAYLLSRILRIVLAVEILPRIQLPRGVPDALELLVRYGVLLFGFLLALGSAGVNLTQVTLALSALGVGMGFGLQHVVNNFVSGLILVFEHPIQVGDLVEVGPHYGEVRRIGFRASVVRSRDGAEVIIPNAELIGTKVLNWTLSDRLHRVNLSAPAPVGADANQVIDILQGVARKCPMVLAEPSPHAVLERFERSSLQFVLRAWVHAEDAFAVRDQLTLAINTAFAEAGIEIPFPQSDVHLHFPDRKVPRVQSADGGKATDRLTQV